MLSGQYTPAATARATGNPVKFAGNTRPGENEKNKTVNPTECQTCKSRTYKDVSSDVSVSFQAATHVSREMSATAVRAHEQEHVANNANSAARQDVKAYSTVAIHTQICPECHRVYVSGGTTTTTYSSSPSPPEPDSEGTKGNHIDAMA